MRTHIAALIVLAALKHAWGAETDAEMLRCQAKAQVADSKLLRCLAACRAPECAARCETRHERGFARLDCGSEHASMPLHVKQAAPRQLRCLASLKRLEARALRCGAACEAHPASTPCRNRCATRHELAAARRPCSADDRNARVPSQLCAFRNKIGTSSGTSFSVAAIYGDLCPSNGDCRTGDVNGDGRADLITFRRGSGTYLGDGDVHVRLSSGNGFQTSAKWHDWFCINDEICRVADVNGDGRADLVAFKRRDRFYPYANTGDVYVALSTGGGFVGTSLKWNDWFCIGNETCEVGDVNGDGRADVVAFTHGVAADVWVGLSNGSSFSAVQKWHDAFCLDGEVCKVGDFNGDREADIVAFTRGGYADVFAAYATGNGAFQGTSMKVHDWFCAWDEVCDLADVTGDRKVDLVAFSRTLGTVWVAPKTSSGFAAGQLWASGFAYGADACLTGDFNGDGRRDVVSMPTVGTCDDNPLIGG